MKTKTYEDYMKREEYQRLANLLLNNKECRNNNAKCIKKYFKKYYNCTIDHAIEDDKMPSIFTIERMIRQLKKCNPKLVGKNAKQDEFQQILIEIPVIVKIL